MNVREMPDVAEVAYSLISDLPAGQQVAFAITVLALVAEENANNPDLKGKYFHTGCRVQNAKNFLAMLTDDHVRICPRAQEPGEIEA